jgi:hypothetical protein
VLLPVVGAGIYALTGRCQSLRDESEAFPSARGVVTATVEKSTIRCV